MEYRQKLTKEFRLWILDTGPSKTDILNEVKSNGEKINRVANQVGSVGAKVNGVEHKVDGVGNSVAQVDEQLNLFRDKTEQVYKGLANYIGFDTRGDAAPDQSLITLFLRRFAPRFSELSSAIESSQRVAVDSRNKIEGLGEFVRTDIGQSIKRIDDETDGMRENLVHSKNELDKLDDILLALAVLEKGADRYDTDLKSLRTEVADLTSSTNKIANTVDSVGLSDGGVLVTLILSALGVGFGGSRLGKIWNAISKQEEAPDLIGNAFSSVRQEIQDSISKEGVLVREVVGQSILSSEKIADKSSELLETVIEREVGGLEVSIGKAVKSEIGAGTKSLETQIDNAFALQKELGERILRAGESNAASVTHVKKDIQEGNQALATQIGKVVEVQKEVEQRIHETDDSNADKLIEAIGASEQRSTQSQRIEVKDLEQKLTNALAGVQKEILRATDVIVKNPTDRLEASLTHHGDMISGEISSLAKSLESCEFNLEEKVSASTTEVLNGVSSTVEGVTQANQRLEETTLQLSSLEQEIGSSILGAQDKLLSHLTDVAGPLRDKLNDCLAQHTALAGSLVEVTQAFRSCEANLTRRIDESTDACSSELSSIHADWGRSEQRLTQTIKETSQQLNAAAIERTQSSQQGVIERLRVLDEKTNQSISGLLPSIRITLDERMSKSEATIDSRFALASDEAKNLAREIGEILDRTSRELEKETSELSKQVGDAALRVINACKESNEISHEKTEAALQINLQNVASDLKEHCTENLQVANERSNTLDRKVAEEFKDCFYKLEKIEVRLRELSTLSTQKQDDPNGCNMRSSRDCDCESDCRKAGEDIQQSLASLWEKMDVLQEILLQLDNECRLNSRQEERKQISIKEQPIDSLSGQIAEELWKNGIQTIGQLAEVSEPRFSELTKEISNLGERSLEKLVTEAKELICCKEEPTTDRTEVVELLRISTLSRKQARALVQLGILSIEQVANLTDNEIPSLARKVKGIGVKKLTEARNEALQIVKLEGKQE